MNQGYFVKEIKEKTKGKYEVSLEGGEPLVLYKKELKAFQVREGGWLSPESYEQIAGELLSKRATRRAMHLLEKQDYTAKALRDKLAASGYPLCAIDAAIAYVSSYHYIDDERYAENYIRYHSGKESRRILKQKLLAKGVDSSVIDRCLEEFCDTDENALALALLRKRKYDPNTADLKEKQRTYAFLARKGISASAISYAMKMDSVEND